METFRTRQFYKFLLFSALIGAVTSLQFLVVITIMNYSTAAIWQGIAGYFGLPYGTASTFFIIGFCALGGLIVGIITKLTRVTPHILADEVSEIVDTGRIWMKPGYVQMIRGVIGLIFGGSIGPEGPLTGGAGALGGYIADKAKIPKQAIIVETYSGVNGMFSAFLGNPFFFPLIGIEGSGKLNWKLVLPGLIAGAVGFGVFDAITHTFYGPVYQFPAYTEFQFVHLLEAVFLGLIGGLVGMLFVRSYRAIKIAIRRWESHPIELSLAAGLILGAVASGFPLVLFDGQNQVNVLLLHTAEYSALFLIVLGLLKLFVTVVCLAFGWNGGYIFPSLFVGASLGLAFHLFFPFIPEIVCLTCTMTGVAVVVLHAPIAMSLLVLGLFGFHLLPIVITSAITAFLLGIGETLVIQEPKGS